LTFKIVKSNIGFFYYKKFLNTEIFSTIITSYGWLSKRHAAFMQDKYARFLKNPAASGGVPDAQKNSRAHFYTRLKNNCLIAFFKSLL
jgi:hypothetical protein